MPVPKRWLHSISLNALSRASRLNSTYANRAIRSPRRMPSAESQSGERTYVHEAALTHKESRFRARQARPRAHRYYACARRGDAGATGTRVGLLLVKHRQDDLIVGATVSAGAEPSAYTRTPARPGYVRRRLRSSRRLEDRRMITRHRCNCSTGRRVTDCGKSLLRLGECIA